MVRARVLGLGHKVPQKHKVRVRYIFQQNDRHGD